MLSLAPQSIALPITLSGAQLGVQAPTEVLAFKLGAEEYGIDILCVQEIRSYEEPTGIANAAAYIKGVINLRGVIVPVIDMRIRFQLASAAYDAFTVVIVLNIGSRVVGMVVDAVSDVIALSAEQLRPAPAFGTVGAINHLLAIATIGRRMLLVLDIEELMSGAETGRVEPRVQSSADAHIKETA